MSQQVQLQLNQQLYILLVLIFVLRALFDISILRYFVTRTVAAVESTRHQFDIYFEEDCSSYSLFLV